MVQNPYEAEDTVVDCIAGAIECKSAGNKALAASKFESAIDLYTEGLLALNEGTLLGSLLLNMSAAFVQQEYNADALACGAAALMLYPEKGTAPQKACYRIAKAAHRLGFNGVALSVLGNVPVFSQSKEVKELKAKAEAASSVHDIGSKDGLAVALLGAQTALQFGYPTPRGSHAQESSEDNIAAAKAIKARGNEAFSEGKYGRAAELWHEALQRLHPAPALLGNMALVHIKRRQWARAMQCAAAALLWDLRGDKPAYRLLQAATESGMAVKALQIVKHRLDNKLLTDSVSPAQWSELMNRMTEIAQKAEAGENEWQGDMMMSEKQVRSWQQEGSRTAREALAMRRETEELWRKQPFFRQQYEALWGPAPPQFDEPFYRKHGVPAGMDAATAQASRDHLSHDGSQSFSDYMKLVNRAAIVYSRARGSEVDGLSATIKHRYNEYEGALPALRMSAVQ